MIIIMVLFVMIEQTYEMYLDCQARCMSKARHEDNPNAIQICRDECEIFELLNQEDGREGKRYRYKLL
jgi:mannitol/fructose-specific phosphotransferase system IIA component (Ntr-type)